MNEGVAGSLDSERGERLRRVRLLLLDVDGVMTDGGLYYAEPGGEFKRFDVKDGAGIYLAMKNGLEVGILTAKTSEMVARRAEEFGLQRVFQGAMNKGECAVGHPGRRKIRPRAGRLYGRRRTRSSGLSTRGLHGLSCGRPRAGQAPRRLRVLAGAAVSAPSASS